MAAQGFVTVLAVVLGTVSGVVLGTVSAVVLGMVPSSVPEMSKEAPSARNRCTGRHTALRATYGPEPASAPRSGGSAQIFTPVCGVVQRACPATVRAPALTYAG
ncbi:hypothetical protein GCM10020295_10120 [Streptomyces cinereospinus]